MSRKKIKQIVLTGTLLAVMATFLFACGSRKQTGNSGGVKETNSSAGSEGAKGRYVETALPMPFEDGAEKVLDLIKTPDGSLELYTLKEGEIGEKKAYFYDGLSWSREEAFAAEGIPEASILSYSAYDKSGALYVIYRDTEYKAHLAKFPPGNSKEEFSVKIEDSPALINGLYVMEDGVVLIPSGDHVLIVGEDGTVKSKLPQRNSFSDFTDSHALTANSFLTVEDQVFLRYGTKDWAEKEVIPFQNDETDIYGSLAAGSGDDFYLANTKGIHHMTAQGTVWETVVDGTLNSMGMPSMTIKRLFVGNSNDFYLWYMENENSRLVHYTFAPEMPSVPARTLTVYGRDLTDNQTGKQAASLFQMENPDTRIELIDGTSQSGSTSKADTGRTAILIKLFFPGRYMKIFCAR